jgi:soluble lytic murein transglycosylase-like protein
MKITINKKCVMNSLPGASKAWCSGIFISMILFLSNYLVFQNLIQRSPALLHEDQQQESVHSTQASLSRASLSLNALEEFKKREHIRTLVFQNFKGVPFNERAKLFEAIYNQSMEMGIDPYLTLSVIATESSFRRTAISWAGAYGLMQIKMITAEEVASELGIPWEGEKTLFDPVVNITLGLRYLANMKKRFGNMSDALTAYNYGPQYVVSCLRSEKTLPDKYVKKIKGHLSRYGLNASGFMGLDSSA